MGQDGTIKGKEGSYVVRAGLRARHAFGVITAVALLAGCSSSKPPAPVAPPVVAGIQLPVFEKSSSPQPGPASVVPIRVVSHGAVIVANVCIGGEGPFPFLVDTGVSTTLVDSSLAARLDLALVDGPRTVSSFTCKRQMLGKVQLPEQTVGSNFTPPGTVGGIGSGTLMNYNPVLVDFTDGELFLGQGKQAQSAGPERAISSG